MIPPLSKKGANCPGGHSRYDAMINFAVPIAYPRLDRCGHVLFTSAKDVGENVLAVGSPVVTLQVTAAAERASSDERLECFDVFCYLEVVQASGDVCYLTEGCFRSSHRAVPAEAQEAGAESECEPTLAAANEGARHTFTEAAWTARPIPRRGSAPVELSFALLPMCYRFSKGSRVRLAIGSTDRHFYSLKGAGSGGGAAGIDILVKGSTVVLPVGCGA